jgi:hypothetical protein
LAQANSPANPLQRPFDQFSILKSVEDSIMSTASRLRINPRRRMVFVRPSFEQLEDRLPPGDALGGLVLASAWGDEATKPSESGFVHADSSTSLQINVLAGASLTQLTSAPASLQVQADARQANPWLAQESPISQAESSAVLFNPFEEDAIPVRGVQTLSGGGKLAADRMPAPSGQVSAPAVAGGSLVRPSFIAPPPPIENSNMAVQAPLGPDATPNIQVNVNQVQFANTASNVSFKGTAVPALPVQAIPGKDVQWDFPQGRRTAPGQKPFANGQIVPAVFVKGQDIQAEVTFSVQSPKVIQTITVSGNIAASYGGTASTFYAGTLKAPAAMSVKNGVASGIFISQAGAAPNFVDINDLTFTFTLTSFTSGGISYSPKPGQANINGQPSMRVYTVLNTPVTPMDTPWVEVLELATALDLLDKGTTLASTFTTETTGIYNSGWNADGIAPNILYIAPVTGTTKFAKLVYSPSAVVRSTRVGGSFATQNYQLTRFIGAMTTPNLGGNNVQQCNDNANLLASLLDSLGDQMLPLNLVVKAGAGGANPLKTNPYFKAGEAAAGMNNFRFHTVGDIPVGGGFTIFDPSAGGAANMPFVNMPLNGAGGYLATAFPNAKPAGAGANIDVIPMTALTVDPPVPPPIEGFRLDTASAGLSPATAKPGTTVGVTATGFSIFNVSSLLITANATGTIDPVPGVTVTNITFNNGGAPAPVLFQLDIESSAPAGSFDLDFQTPDTDVVFTLTFTITPAST